MLEDKEIIGHRFVINNGAPDLTLTGFGGKKFSGVKLGPGKYLIYREAGEYWLAQKLEVLPDQ